MSLWDKAAICFKLVLPPNPFPIKTPMDILAHRFFVPSYFLSLQAFPWKIPVPFLSTI